MAKIVAGLGPLLGGVIHGVPSGIESTCEIHTESESDGLGADAALPSDPETR